MRNRNLAPLFFAEWLVLSVYIDMVLHQEHLRFAWRLYVIWVVLAIPLLLYAVYKEGEREKKNEG